MIALDPIQVLWVRGDLSRLELLSVRSFLAHGHPVHLYSYAPPQNLPPGVTVLDAATIVPADRAPLAPGSPFGRGTMGSFSDYFRYQLLTLRGGWWSDLDVVCVKPWRFAAPALTASTQELGYGRIANGFAMRFPAGHPVMRACLAALAPADLRQLDIGQTGPQLIHRVMQELGAGDLMTAPSVFAPIAWNAGFQLVRTWRERLSLEELKQRVRRPHLSVRFTRDTVAVHLWNETWRSEGRAKDAVYPRSCLYERLQRRYNPASA